MKENNIDEQLDLLKQIGRVEPSPFLFTRISGKLEQSHVPRSWKLVFSTAMILLIFTNGWLLLSSKVQHQPSQSDADRLAQTMHLKSSNELYHD